MHRTSLFVCCAMIFGCGEDPGQDLEDLPVVGEPRETVIDDNEVGYNDMSDHGVLFIIDENGEIVQDLHRGVCVRVAWGPGKVKWDSSNPGWGGQYYSVAPESNPNLIWASAPQQDIDAIYNTFWGCGTALKIPNSCTATVSTGGNISTCCNAAMMALGHVPVWVNTYSDPYFVDCPL